MDWMSYLLGLMTLPTIVGIFVIMFRYGIMDKVKDAIKSKRKKEMK